MGIVGRAEREVCVPLLFARHTPVGRRQEGWGLAQAEFDRESDTKK